MLWSLKPDIFKYEVGQQNLEKSNSVGCSLEFYALPSASQKKKLWFANLSEKLPLLEVSGVSALTLLHGTWSSQTRAW